jgi:hypothetical protein
MNMKALYNLLWTGLMILGISSCASEFPNGGGGEELPAVEEKGILYVPMTRGDIVDESAIVKVRMIVFKANGVCVKNTTQPKTTTPVVFIDSVPTGYLNVYLIANERTEWTTTLDGITSEAQLKNIKYEYSTYSNYATKLPEADQNPLANRQVPMFGEKKNVYVSIKGEPNPYEIAVKRIFAKVTLQLECMFADSVQHNGDVELALDTVRLWRIPPHSWLITERYTGSSFWFNTHDPQFLPFRPDPVSPPVGWPVPPMSSAYKEIPGSPGYPARFKDSICFYIPEYIPNDTSLYAHLSIKVGIKAQPHISKTYRLILGEGLIYGSKFMKGDSVVNGHQRDVLDLSIQRNTHYEIKANIRNFGLTGNEDMDVYLKVEQWKDTPIDSIDVIDYTLNVSQSDFNIPVGHTAVVRIETNHPYGWSATITDINGTIITGLVLNGSLANLSGQESGPLNFKATVAGTYYINVTVGKITKRIKVVAT